jgi:hypothetical protein
MFAAEKRENPVDIHYPFGVQDTVQVTLPPGLTLESLPKSITTVSPLGAEYKIIDTNKDGSYKQVRLLAVGNTFFLTKEYPQLRTFFQNANAQDQQSVVLQRTAVTGASGAGKGQ